jgi:hypothetical protein
VTRRTREDYEELDRLFDAAQIDVAKLLGKIMDMFSTLDEVNRPVPTRFDEWALAISLSLQELRDELDFERRDDIGEPETP